RRTPPRRAGSPRRPCSPGAAAVPASPRSPALLLRRRVGRGDEALALFRRQRLGFRPGVAQLLALFRRRLGDALVILARLAALLGAELRPVLHASLHALLLLGLHPGIAVGDADPFAPPLGLEALPVGPEGREHHLLVRGELGPGRAHRRL